MPILPIAVLFMRAHIESYGEIFLKCYILALFPYSSINILELDQFCSSVAYLKAHGLSIKE
jgi:hypothetical protein